MKIKTNLKYVPLIAFAFILYGKPLFADDKVNREFLNEVIKEFKEQCKGRSGIDYLNCWADHSPEKCKSLVYGKDRTGWSRCVFSCGSQGFYSKTFGECSE